MAAIARFGQFVFGAPRDHILAERDKSGHQILQIHLDGTAIVQRQHVDAEAAL